MSRKAEYLKIDEVKLVNLRILIKEGQCRSGPLGEWLTHFNAKKSGYPGITACCQKTFLSIFFLQTFSRYSHEFHSLIINSPIMSSTVASATRTEQKIYATTRIQAVDVLRGAVMVLMAIDHVRVYSGLPAGGPEPGIFFTRWITHFCAPAFVFFAGTSAFLYGQKVNNKGKLARYLVTRGLMLVILELTLIRFTWTFNLDFSQFMLAGVIWMLGWCMVLLAAMVWLKPSTIGIAGVVIICAQQLFGLVPGLFPEAVKNAIGPFWHFIYPSDAPGPNGISVLYVIVPWIGVMMAGYGFGSILMLDPARMRRICLWLGLTAIAIFLAWGSVVATKVANDSDELPFLFRLLGQRKYPASVLYLLMTIGPAIALTPLAGSAKNAVAKWLGTIGRVPLFYYLLHIPLIHISALAVALIRNGQMNHEWYATAPFSQVPPEHQWNLGMLYFVFLIDVVLLYLACRWYAKYKMDHPGKKWLTYI